MNNKPTLLWVLAFCAASVAVSFMLARPNEKPATDTNAPVRVQVDNGYMSNGLIVVTNLKTVMDTNIFRCEKCGYSGTDAPTNAWPDAEISRDRFRAMLDNEAARRQHAFRSNQHYWLHGGNVKP